MGFYRNLWSLQDMNKSAKLLPSCLLACAVVSFFTVLNYHEFKTILITSSIGLSLFFIAMTWRKTKNRGRIESYKEELTLSGLLFALGILLSFLSFGGLAPLLIWSVIYSLALCLYVLEAQDLEKPLASGRSIKKKALIFTILTFVLCVFLNRFIWDAPKMAVLKMRWRYGVHQSKECRAPDCNTIVLHAAERLNCEYELQIDSPDLGKYLEAYGESVVPVAFELRYGGQQVNTKKIGELGEWRSYWGTSSGRSHCFD